MKIKLLICLYADVLKKMLKKMLVHLFDIVVRFLHISILAYQHIARRSHIIISSHNHVIVVTSLLIIISSYRHIACLSAQSYIEETYDTGVTQFQDGSYEIAIESFDIVISTATKNDKDFLRKAYLYKADALSELIVLDASLKEYNNIIEKFPNTEESLKARLGVGIIYYKENNYKLACQYFLNFMKRFPNTKITDNAQYWLGMLHFKNKNFKKATISFTALTQNYPKSDYIVDSWLRLGNSYFNMKKYKQARNSYEKILTKYPLAEQVEFALCDIGRTYELEGATLKAITTYAQFVERYPKSQLSPEITYRVAEYFYKMKDYDAASKYFKQIISNFPKHNLSEDANFMCSKIYYKMGASTDAIRLFQKFVETYPSSKKYTEAILYIGNCYLELFDYHKAIENYEIGLKFENSDHEVFAMIKYNYGIAYEKIMNLLEAEKHFNEILTRYPKSFAAIHIYIRQGNEFEKNGDYFAAIENYELAAIISKNKMVQKTNGLSTDIGGAIGALAQKKVADCYFMQKKYKQASYEYLKVVYLFSDSQYVPETYYMSARASEEIGFIKDAKRNYEIVKKRYDDTLWAKKAQERLDNIDESNAKNEGNER
ncbi:MAG: tetratricopeptide repeat protein [Elusimicrobiota bacterium]